MLKTLLILMMSLLIGGAQAANIPLSVGLPPDSDQVGEGMHYWPDGRFEVFVAFDVDYTSDEPDWQGIWKVSVEDRYSEYITLNGELLKDIIRSNPNKDGRYTISIHNDIRGHGLRLYCIEGLESGLDREKENTIVFEKDFPLLDGVTLDKSYKFIYDPKTREWKGSIVD